MVSVTDDVRTLLVRELTTFVAEIELFPDDELIWRTAPGVNNSVANLALHVSGNLQHFVGAVLGGTGYVRNRPAEFGTRVGTRADIVAQLELAMAAVERVLPTLSDEQLAAGYPEQVQDVTIPTQRFLMQLASHLALHLGQAGYLRRVLTGDGRSTDPVQARLLVSPGTAGGA